MANELTRRGLFVSPTGVRSVWLRHDLENFLKRLKELEAKAAQEHLVLTEDQLRAMERAREEKEAHGEIETAHPGYLGAQDTYYVGTIMRTAHLSADLLDTYAKVGSAKLYDRKTALVAADLLNDRVLPFFEEHGRPCCARAHRSRHGVLRPARASRVRTVPGGGEHRSAASQGSASVDQRYLRTLPSHHPGRVYATAFRKKLYNNLDELQMDLDDWLAEYNRTRPHSGRWRRKDPDADFLRFGFWHGRKCSTHPRSQRRSRSGALGAERGGARLRKQPLNHNQSVRSSLNYYNLLLKSV